VLSVIEGDGSGDGGGMHAGKITIHDYDFFTIDRQERKVRKEVKIMPTCNATVTQI
jgi:hypothetical protein